MPVEPFTYQCHEDGSITYEQPKEDCPSGADWSDREVKAQKRAAVDDQLAALLRDCEVEIDTGVALVRGRFKKVIRCP